MLKHFLLLCACIGLLNQAGLAQADLTLAKQLYLYEQLETAEQELKTLLQTKPKNTDEVYFWLGKIQYEREDYPGARAYFDQALIYKSKSSWGAIGQGMIAFKESRIAEGRKWIYKGLEQVSKRGNSELELAAAKALLDGGKEEIGDARQILYDLKDRMVSDPRPYVYLGFYYIASDVVTLAIGELEKSHSDGSGLCASLCVFGRVVLRRWQGNWKSRVFQPGL